ncbi:MAG: gliding motility-associated-like protein [Parvicellaceae bacterium]|jgi:gliding motility-associated-like protein
MKYAAITLSLLLSIAGFSQAPIAAFTASDQTICPTQCIDFTDVSTSVAAGGILTWNWDFGNGLTSTLPNPTGICYLTAGSFNIILTVSDANGFDTEIQVGFITVDAAFCGVAPVADFSSTDSIFCVGTCIDFTDLSVTTAFAGITNWDWNFGNGQTSTLPNPTNICYNTSGLFTVTLAVTDANGFDNQIDIDFILVSDCTGPATVFAVDNNNICADSCINFTDASTTIAVGGVTAWEWTFTGGTPSTFSGEFPPTICYGTNGSFDVQLITTDSDGSDTLVQSAMVIVNNPLAIPVSADTTITSGDSATLVSGSGFTGYIWSPIDSLSCVACQNTMAAPLSNTLYTITAIDVNGCPTSDSVFVTIIPAPDTLMLPNVFTPNGDGINDQFIITAPEGFEMEVYNRWGQLIYRSSLQHFWDGRTNTGEIVSDGTYYYVVVLESGDTHTGFVTVKK